MKKVLYVILGLLVGYLFLCLAGPSIVGAERSVTINSPVEQVKAQLLDLKFFQEKWSPWTGKDPNMKVTYNGETGKPGNSYSWESDNKDVGKGHLEIVGVNGDSLLQTLTFEGMGASKIYFISQANGEATKVTWGMNSVVPFFGRGVMMFMNMDKMIGPDFETGLGKLKAEMEAMPAEAVATNYEVKEIDWEEKAYFGKRKLISFEEIEAYFGENWGKIMEDMSKNKIIPLTAPSSIYFTFDMSKGQTDLAAVIGAAKDAKGLKGWEKFQVSGTKALHVAYYGDPSKTMDAHAAIGDYMIEKNISSAFIIEESVTDPSVEKDMTKFLTNIYYVLK